VDQDGNSYLAGDTASDDFPTAGPLTGQTCSGGGTDAFVTKLNAAGNGLTYSTCLGGSGTDTAYAIALDSANQAHVAGVTASSNFTTTAGVVQTAHQGGNDAFVTKLNAAGSALLYSTYLGGSSGDTGYGIGLDGNGNAYVAGETGSTNFYTTTASYQITKAGNNDAFLTKLTTAGAGGYSTYLGGTGLDYARGLAVDAAGNAYLTGRTHSSGFPLLSAADSTYASTEAFVTKVLTTGAALGYSTFLGGDGTEEGTALTLDAAGQVYAAGWTTSSNFPITNAVQASFAGVRDATVVHLDASGQFVYSTYLGGAAGDTPHAIAADDAGYAYVAGETQSANFPVAYAFQAARSGVTVDAFVTRLGELPTVQFSSAVIPRSKVPTGFHPMGPRVPQPMGPSRFQPKGPNCFHPVGPSGFHPKGPSRLRRG
jgi:hypothetical protein